MSTARRCWGAAAGLVLDAVVPEPADDHHPVAWFGRAMIAVEDRIWGPGRIRGAVYTAAGVATGIGAGRMIRSTAVATTIATARANLAATARSIGDPLEAGDLDLARERLPALVGRDPSRLDRSEIARAVIESVAENTVDAVVAPALWAAAAGAPGALAYRAVNTMDAMVGHRSLRHERFGWASARLDDAANWVPARATVALTMAARPERAATIARTVRRDAPAHPSPNAGPVEAAFAAALDVRLGGTNDYDGRIEERGTLGDGKPAEPADIERAIALMDQVTVLLGVGLVGVGLADATRRRSPSMTDPAP